MIREHNIYVAPFINSEEDNFGNTINKYGTPFIIKELTLNSLNGSTEIAMFGDKINQMCKSLLDYDEWFDKIEANDLAYLYTATPIGEKVNGEFANYRVKSVLPQNFKIAIYFERL